MAITEQDRRDLFNGLEEAIGTEPANKLMELLPHPPSDQLLTEFRAEVARLRADLRLERAERRLAIATAETRLLVIGGIVANAIAVITALLT